MKLQFKSKVASQRNVNPGSNKEFIEKMLIITLLFINEISFDL